MKRILATTALLATCVAASATTFDFSSLVPNSFAACTGLDRCGDPLEFTLDGLTVTVKAFYNDEVADAVTVQDNYSGSTFVGLGVYHTFDVNGVPNDSSDDNVTNGEYLTLHFSKAINLTTLTFRSDGHGADFGAYTQSTEVKVKYSS